MDIAAKKAVVANFLDRCNRYAAAELDKRRARLVTADGFEALTLQDEILHWAAYRAFNQHALKELAGNDLDDWFVEDERE